MPSLHSLIRSLIRGRKAIPHRTHRPDLRVRLSLNSLLEDRVTPSLTFNLGTAAQFGVLGLQGTAITNQKGITITGNEGVSQNGSLINQKASVVSGSVSEYAGGQYSGPGQVSGGVVVNSSLIAQADSDALSASASASAQTITQSFGNISSATTITGNGDVNVIDISGKITASVILSGSANDVFVVNVHGNLSLSGSSVLGLAGAVTADHVLYNFVGQNSSIMAGSGNVLNGTLLAPTGSFNLKGAAVDGEVIAGGLQVTLGSGTQVNQITFVPPVAQASASISGVVFQDDNHDLIQDNGELGFSNVTVTLTGTDSNNQPVNLSVQPDDTGFYSFTGLSAGNYTLTITVNTPQTATGVAGTVNGQLDGSGGPGAINSIVLGASDQAVNYNFAVAPLLA
jgi:choice-of-anchor A domain-containing protein